MEQYSRIAYKRCCLRNTLYFGVPVVTHVLRLPSSYRASETFIHFKNFVTFRILAYLTSEYRVQIKYVLYCRMEGHAEIFIISCILYFRGLTNISRYQRMSLALETVTANILCVHRQPTIQYQLHSLWVVSRYFRNLHTEALNRRIAEE